MSVSTDDVFRKAVLNVLDGWTALQLAVEHGMGGPDSRSKAKALIDSVLNLFKDNPNADWQEVADFLTDTMDDEFDTICEDDSCDEVGFLLWEFHKRCVSGDVNSVDDELSKLPSAGHWLSQLSKPLTANQSEEAQADTISSMNLEETMDVDAVEETGAIATEPGWTTVIRKKK